MSCALTIAWSAKAASRSAGSKSAIRFHSATYGDAGFLRLERDDASDGLDDVERLAAEQQLAGQRGAVELAGGEAHRGILAARPGGAAGGR